MIRWLINFKKKQWILNKCLLRILLNFKFAYSNSLYIIKNLIENLPIFWRSIKKLITNFKINFNIFTLFPKLYQIFYFRDGSITIVHACPTVPSSWRHSAKLQIRLSVFNDQKIPPRCSQSVHNRSSDWPNLPLEQCFRCLCNRILRSLFCHSHARGWHRFDSDAWHHSTSFGQAQRVSISYESLIDIYRVCYTRWTG